MRRTFFHMVHGVLKEIRPSEEDKIVLSLTRGHEGDPITYARVPQELYEKLRPLVGQWIVATDAGGSWRCGPSRAYDHLFGEGATVESLFAHCGRRAEP